MDNTELKWFATICLIAFAFIARLLFKGIVNRSLKKFNFSLQRRKITVKSLTLLVTLLTIILIIAVWGVKKSDLLVFVSTALTILGIGFVAQWSILSNVTAGLILFFYHPLKLGDKVSMLDKDYPVTGRITDITYFFIHLKTDNNIVITVPNTVALYKMIKIWPGN